MKSTGGPSCRLGAFLGVGGRELPAEGPSSASVSHKVPTEVTRSSI